MLSGNTASQIARFELDAMNQSLAQEEKLRNDILVDDFETWETYNTRTRESQSMGNRFAALNQRLVSVMQNPRIAGKMRSLLMVRAPRS